jgi:hypothetical protein
MVLKIKKTTMLNGSLLEEYKKIENIIFQRKVDPTKVQDSLNKVKVEISEAKKEGCKRITLLTDIENTKAQSFYQRKGFVKSKMTPYRLLLD